MPYPLNIEGLVAVCDNSQYTVVCGKVGVLPTAAFIEAGQLLSAKLAGSGQSGLERNSGIANIVCIANQLNDSWMSWR